MHVCMQKLRVCVYTIHTSTPHPPTHTHTHTHTPLLSVPETKTAPAHHQPLHELWKQNTSEVLVCGSQSGSSSGTTPADFLPPEYLVSLPQYVQGFCMHTDVPTGHKRTQMYPQVTREHRCTRRSQENTDAPAGHKRTQMHPQVTREHRCTRRSQENTDVPTGHKRAEMHITQTTTPDQ